MDHDDMQAGKTVKQPTGNGSEAIQLAKAAQTDPLLRLMQDPYGNYVIGKAVQVCPRAPSHGDASCTQHTLTVTLTKFCGSLLPGRGMSPRLVGTA